MQRMDHGNSPFTDGGHNSRSKSKINMKDSESISHQSKEKTTNMLGAVPLLRSSKDASSKPAGATDGDGMNVEGVKRGSSIATALQHYHGRKRKGSLRKTAIAKMREGFTSSFKERTNTAPIITTTMSTPSADEIETDFFEPENTHHNPAISDNSQTTQQSQSLEQFSSSPFRSSKVPYISTTDEEEMSFHRPPNSTSSSSIERSDQDPAASVALRRSHRPALQAFHEDYSTPDELDIEDDWDYSETEWWGWVILIATWIVFVVVMGSCFGVWSWAWDVGETPYAPPDLEDDDTLPITGYYPALMVCTAVMSWVWVVVAWVGMKYFQHSKVDG